MNAIEIAERGYVEWAAKPHNAKWVRQIEGTPIPNDLKVCIAMAFKDALSAERARVIDYLLKIVERSENGDLGTSKVRDMADIAKDALRAALLKASHGGTKGDPKDHDAAVAFRDQLVPKADQLEHGTYPLWYGWAIVEAFLAGAAHARKADRSPSPTEGDGNV